MRNFCSPAILFGCGVKYLAMDFKKLLVRTVSGVIYIGIIIGAVLCGVNGVFALAILLAVLGTIESSKIFHELGNRNIPTLILDIIGCICLCGAYMFYPILVWVGVMLFRMVLELYARTEDPVKNLAHSMLDQIYIGVPMGIMVLTAAMASTPYILLAIFFLIWINDTGAFLVGSMLGRHRLFERISPKKSWEGFFGGLIFNIIAGIIFSTCCSGFFGMPANIPAWIGMGIVVTVFSTWGDLVESMIKRRFHIKDSGNLIPGHGGILDRIDSLLFAVPAVFLYLIMLKLIWF